MEEIEKVEDGDFIFIMNRGIKIKVLVISIVVGLGCFEFCKLLIDNLVCFEDKGVEYIIKDFEVYCDKRVVVVGGGDFVLDWIIFLVDVVEEVILIY